MKFSRRSQIAILALSSVLASVNAASFTTEVCEEHKAVDGVNLESLQIQVTESESCHEDPVSVRLNGSIAPEKLAEMPNILLEMRAEGILLSKKELEFCSSSSSQVADCVSINNDGEFTINTSLTAATGLPAGVSRTVDAFLVAPSTHILGCIWGRLRFSPSSNGNLSAFKEFTKEEIETLYAHWLKEHGEPIGGTTKDRMTAFAQNLEDVALHNQALNAPYELALNQFATHTPEEYRKILGYKPELGKGNKHAEPSLISRRLGANAADEQRISGLPKEVDWVSKGAVTPVKNQGACGSCWSFSTTGAMEGAYFLKTGKLVSFSEQEMVSCDHVDLGCGGGLMDNAFTWIEKNGGLCAEKDYPYVSGSGASPRCKQSSCTPVPGTVPRDYKDVKKNSVADMMETVSKQPVAIAIEADQLPFQFYRKGVLKRWCGTRLDHGVLLVGYGNYEETGMDYWKVKNSWGATWGAKGYLLIQRGKHQNGGECGILLSGSVPEL